jgi:hypothetical protein
MTSIFIHYSLHFFLPLLIAKFFFRKKWKKVYIIMISTMIVDIDHLLASPIYQADRCSINFHPLHSYFAIAIYIIMSFFKKPLNLIGIGLVIHMFADFCDCFI